MVKFTGKEKYEDADNNRVARKVEKLMNSHPGRNLLSIIKELSNIKDEFTSLLDLPDHKFEYYLDQALMNTAAQ